MRKRSMTILAAAALAASLTVGGCGSKSPEAGGKFGGEKGLTVAPSTEAETEAETEPELDEETMEYFVFLVSAGLFDCVAVGALTLRHLAGVLTARPRPVTESQE